MDKAVVIGDLQIRIDNSIVAISDKLYSFWCPIAFIYHSLDFDKPVGEQLYWVVSIVGASGSSKKKEVPLPEDIPSDDIKAAFEWAKMMAKLGLLRSLCEGGEK